MESIMVVGADKLGNIEKKLQKLGFNKILHINGRKTSDVKLNIPNEVKIVLVFTDFINHNLAKKIKDRAKECSIPIIYSKRSWSKVHRSLRSLNFS